MTKLMRWLLFSRREQSEPIPNDPTLAEKDWLVARQSLLNSENNGYLLTLGVILSSYAAALLLGAGWILSGTLISTSPDLQVGQLVAQYPNAAVSILIFAAVSIAYFNAATIIGYLYLENRLQLMVLDFRMMTVCCFSVDEINDIIGLRASSQNRVFIAFPLVLVDTAIPFFTSAIIIIRFLEWLQHIQAFSWPVTFLFIIDCVWMLLSTLVFTIATWDITKRNIRCLDFIRGKADDG